jgi:enoyl-CoA hydratase/carnithine racemase
MILCATKGAARWITLNRPHVLNAMNSEMIAALRSALSEAVASPEIRVVVFNGAGDRAFSAGADINELAPFGPAEAAAYNRNWLNFFREIELAPKPVIASVHGWATGGGTEMSLACDFVVCAEDARFGLSEINIGVIPGAGAAVRLTRWLGRLKSKEILMLGRPIDGRAAVDLELANMCVPRGELLDRTQALADELASKAPLALAAAKASVNVGAEASFDVALEYELREFLGLFHTRDQKEGMQAFLEKRPPRFQGA